MSLDKWYKRHLGDYFKFIRYDITPLEECVYSRLEAAYWLHGPFPNDDAKLASYAGVSVEQWREMRPKFERVYSVSSRKWRNPYLDKARKVAASNRRKAVEAATARWSQKDDASGNASSIADAPRSASSMDASSNAPWTQKPRNQDTRITTRGRYVHCTPETAKIFQNLASFDNKKDES